MTLLKVEHLVKRYTADVPVVDDVSFEVRPGEVFVLLGESGCGKTTTLRAIAGFERADAGRIEFDGRLLDGDGRHVRPERRGVGFVFQDYALFPHLSVLRNVMYGLRGLGRQARRDRAMQVLKMVGLLHARDRRPQELSGGQQQRVAVARSVAPSPKLILLDEPFSNVDAGMRAAMRGDLRQTLEHEGMSAVLVTHDQEEALSFADRLAVMHEGRIAQSGRPEDVYRRPATAFVAQFLGRTNLVRVMGRGEVADTPLGPVRLSHRTQGEAIVSMRPEHLTLRPPQLGRPRGTVILRTYKGHDLSFKVRVDKRTYEVHTDFRCPFVPGDTVNVVPRESAVVLRDELHGRAGDSLPRNQALMAEAQASEAGGGSRGERP